MLSSYKIFNEDCHKTMEEMQEKSVDFVLTSPPYNMTSRPGGLSGTNRYDFYRDWKSEDEYISFTLDTFRLFDKILRDESVVVYNFSYSIENPALPYKLISAIESESNFSLVDTIVWKKKNAVPFPANKQRLSRIWEFVWIFSRKKDTNSFRTNRKVASISQKTGQHYYDVHYNFVEAKNNDVGTFDLNQATYSTELCKKIMNIYCRDGYVVYDPFLGTGTTMNACAECEDKNLICYGSELSAKQCEYAEQRVKSSVNTNTLSSFLF